jgi:NTE family protein
MRTKKIGLALGGGGARGLAHLGVIKVLYEKGIKPDLIVGTSIGAIIGAMLASAGTVEAVAERVEAYFNCDCFKKIQFDTFTEENGEPRNDGLFDALSHILRRKLFFNISLNRHQSYVGLDEYQENINALIDDIDIRDTRIPLAVVCTDIHAGEAALLTKGPLRGAVAASAAIPGIFPPIDFEGRTMVDGGWVDQLPAGPCRRLGADLVIGVDVARELEQDFSLESGFDIIRRTNSITRTILTRLQSREADILIAPEVGRLSWARFDCTEECVKLGETAAREALPAIADKLASMESFLSRLFASRN